MAFGESPKNHSTKKGTQPNPTTAPKVVNGVIVHPGRNRPAKGFNQVTREWEQWNN
jgi:hypothetical protein